MDVLRYAVQIAGGLEAARRAGIVHRDLKPGNVMVTADGRIKVLDFGLAIVAVPDSRTTATTLTLVAGTAAYMGPEQAEGRAANGRSDIYSLGAVLCEMLAGRRAFACLSRQEPPSLGPAAAGAGGLWHVASKGTPRKDSRPQPS